MSSRKSLQHIKTQQNGLNRAFPCISMPVQCSRSMILQRWYIRFYVLDRLPTLTTTCTTSNQISQLVVPLLKNHFNHSNQKTAGNKTQKVTFLLNLETLPSSLPGLETIPRADFNVNHLHIHCLGCGSHGLQLLRSQSDLRTCKFILKIMGCFRREVCQVCSYIRYISNISGTVFF